MHIQIDENREQAIRGIKEDNSDNADTNSSQSAGSDSQKLKLEPQRVSRAVCSGDVSGSSNTGEANVGKILSQLRTLQKAHLAYVDAHGERLEARLRENRDHKQTVLEEMEELEQEVLKLVTTEIEGS